MLTIVGGYGVSDAHTLGVALRLRREAAGLTQREVADRAGISRQLLVKIESGHARAEIGKVMSLVRALGATLVLDDARGVRAGPEVDLDQLLGGF